MSTAVTELPPASGVPCPSCGQLQGSSRFCTNCGQQLTVAEVISVVPGLEAAASVAEPATASYGVAAIASSFRLPHVAALGHARMMHWVGAHGGAGEDTLARAIPGSVAAGHGWPVASADYRLAPVAVPVMLVARTNARGLFAAQNALRDWASGAVQPLSFYGLVLIADAPGALPKPLKDLKKLVEGGAPHVVDVPFLHELRLGEDPGQSGNASFNFLRTVVAGILNSTTN